MVEINLRVLSIKINCLKQIIHPFRELISQTVKHKYMLMKRLDESVLGLANGPKV